VLSICHPLPSPVLEMTHVRSDSTQATSGNETPSTIAVMSSGGNTMSPANWRFQRWQASSAFCLDGRSAGLEYDGTLSYQMKQGMAASMQAHAWDIRNKGSDTERPLIKAYLHGSLSMNKSKRRPFSKCLIFHLMHSTANISI